MAWRWHRRARTEERGDTSSFVDGITLRAALFMGFGVTLGIWAFDGLYFASRIAEVSRTSSATRSRGGARA